MVKTSDKRSFMRAALATSKSFLPGAPPPVVPFADWDYYYTTKELAWKANGSAPGSVSEVKVPAGFVTDLASIPSPFWSVLPPAARYSYAAIVHDYLYWFQPCERGQADGVFKSAMEDLDVAGAKVTIIYDAVRLAGGRSWKANAAARDSGERRLLKRYPADMTTTWESWKAQSDVFAADP